MKEVYACIDRNILTREYAILALQGIQYGPPTPKQIADKRNEAFADLLRKQYLKKQNLQGRALANAISMLCPPEPSKNSKYDSHPSAQFRIISTIHGIEPLLGESYGIPEPEDCETILWPVIK